MARGSSKLNRLIAIVGVGACTVTTSWQCQAEGVKTEASSSSAGTDSSVQSREAKSVPASVMAADLGVDAGSPVVERFTSGDFRTRSLDRLERAGTRSVIKHVRGEEGIPLTFANNPFGATQLVPPRPDRTQITNYLQREKVAKREYELKHGTDILLAKRSIVACEADESKREDVLTTKKKPAKLQVIKTDMLFIEKGKAIEEPDKAFGKNVNVVEIGRDLPVGEVMSRVYGVSCLPFRYTVTTDHIIKRAGPSALRNFDENPLGKGKLAGNMIEQALK
jgi:hypothetical protein